MATCNVPALLASLPQNAAATHNRYWLAKLALLCSILRKFNSVATCDLPTLMKSGACFCAVTRVPGEIAELQLLCEINAVAGGGGGGATCIVGGVGAPAGAPPCNFSIYIQQPGPNFGLWLGDTVTGWASVIAQGP